MRPGHLVAFVLLVAGCHFFRPDDKPTSPIEMCHACCQQAKDACKADSDHPGYYCPRDYQECVTACDSGDENQMCVVQINRQLAAKAPKPAPAAAPQDHQQPPAAVAKAPPPAKRGECDSQGTWKLIIADAKGRGAGCSGLGDVPRQINFRLQRKSDAYVLRDLIPAPGWSDGFTVTNQSDSCVVTLTRENRVDADHPRTISVALNEVGGNVTGTFHYSEEMLQPAACTLEAPVSGALISPPPRPSPPQMQTLPPPPPPQPRVR